jgi:hypothetical protein
MAPRAPLQSKLCQRFGHTQGSSAYAPQDFSCDEPHLSGERSTSMQPLKKCSCGGNHTANYLGCSKWKEAKAALAKRAPIARNLTKGATGRSATLQAVRAKPSAEQENLGPGWPHIVRGERVVKSTTPSLLKHTPRQVAVVNKQDKATECRPDAKTTQSAPKATAAPEQNPVTNKKEKANTSTPSPKE